jgi:hypothetical protein
LRVPLLPNLGRPALSFFWARLHQARSSAFRGFERDRRCAGASASISATTAARCWSVMASNFSPVNSFSRDAASGKRAVFLVAILITFGAVAFLRFAGSE